MVVEEGVNVLVGYGELNCGVDKWLAAGAHPVSNKNTNA